MFHNVFVSTFYSIKNNKIKSFAQHPDVDCGAPEKIDNGKISLVSNATYYGALALYSCDPNFELDGVSRRLCLENGTWSSDPPACRGERIKLYLKFKS